VITGLQIPAGGDRPPGLCLAARHLRDV